MDIALISFISLTISRDLLSMPAVQLVCQKRTTKQVLSFFTEDFNLPMEQVLNVSMK
jgi:hypothetical protein